MESRSIDVRVCVLIVAFAVSSASASFYVTTDKPVYQYGEDIEITVTVGWGGSYLFPSSLISSYTIDDQYRWADDKVGLAVMTWVDFPATWDFTHSLNVPLGNHSIVGEVMLSWTISEFSEQAFFEVVAPPMVGDIAPAGSPNGIVDGADLGALLARWKTDDPTADIAPVGAPDGIVDGADLGALLARWGNSIYSSPSPAIPEPATLSLLALAGIGMLRKRRK